MTLFDYFALVIIGLSTLVALMRGVVAELASLVTWVVSFLVGKVFAVPFAEIALPNIDPPNLRIALSFILLFFVAWIAQYFLRSFLTSAISALGLGAINRLLGLVFGFARGVLVMVVIVGVCAFTELPKQPEWQASLTAPTFELLVKQTLPYLPESLATEIPY